MRPPLVLFKRKALVEDEGVTDLIPLRLTGRDIQIFRLLNEHRFMVAGQIYQIFWPESEATSGTARQRLTKLVEAGYAKLIEEEKKRLRLFLLTRKGIQVLKERGLDHGFTEVMSVNPALVEHTLKLVNIRHVMTELGAVHWMTEPLIRKEEAWRGWFPDAAFEISGLRLAIELENSFRSKELYISRFRRYQDAKEFALVIYIVSWPAVRTWLIDLEAPQNKLGFVTYHDLIQKKGEAEFENKTSKIKLGSIFE